MKPAPRAELRLGSGDRNSSAPAGFGAVMKRILILAACAATIAALGVPAAASAKKNPYTAAGVCGPGYRVIDRHRLWDYNSSNGNKVTLATVVLTYNSANGNNCAVTMKRYRVGKRRRGGIDDWLYVSLAARPLSDATVEGDSGNFKFFAGPVYVPARNRCVQWGGGASLLVPANHTPRGHYNSAYKSRWEHCG